MIKKICDRANGKKIEDLFFYAVILAFPVLQFCVFYIGVNFNSLLLAFKNYESYNSYSWSGLSNFENLFVMFGEKTLYAVAFKNSLKSFVWGTACGLLLGLFFSYYIFKKGFAYNFFKVCLFLPSIIPAIALVVMFKQFADGAMPQILGKIGFHVKGLLAEPKLTFGSIIFYNVWISFGTGILMYAGAMENIPESIFEAAKLDGASYGIEFFKIVFPLIWGTFSTFFIVNVGSIFINSMNIYAFYGPNAEESVYTIGYFLYNESVKTNAYANYPQLAAFGIVLSLITLPFVYLSKFILKKIGPAAD